MSMQIGQWYPSGCMNYKYALPMDGAQCREYFATTQLIGWAPLNHAYVISISTTALLLVMASGIQVVKATN